MSSVGTKRVRDVAKELGRDIKDVLTAAERAGIRGKKPQSGLTEEEVRKLHQLLETSESPGGTVVIGETVVTRREGQEHVETRVSDNIIRRRPKLDQPVGAVGTEAASHARLQSPVAGEVGLVEPLSAEPLSAPDLAPLPPITEDLVPPSLPEVESLSGALPGLEREPVVEKGSPSAGAPSTLTETGSVAPLPEESAIAALGTLENSPGAPSALQGDPKLQGVDGEAQVQTGSGSAVPGNQGAAPADGQARRGPKVLGRIDLSRQGTARARAPRERPGSQPIERVPTAIPLPTPVEGRPRKKKRRVVERAETIDAVELGIRRNKLPKKKKPAPGQEVQKTEITVPRAHKRVIRIAREVITARELAREMAVRETEVVKKLLELGVLANVNKPLDFDEAFLVAQEFGFTIERVADNLEARLEDEPAVVGAEENLVPRPPVVTIMGHVDHGKTSLLDAIRQTNVTAQEAGGITQHIGAYTVEVDGRKITFLDTPGHEAFTAMRARGAKVTDIVVLVVAADDGVMPQTVEAIDHARAAGVPIIVAVNKIDKPDANVERVTRELAERGLAPEEWGGDTTFVKVSAKTKEGIPELLEMILLRADIQELKANPDRRARGTIIEAKLDRGRGPVATVLIQQGTLREGEPFVCGPYFGRVRALIDDKGRRVKEAGPSTPVEILGFDGVPEAGSTFVVAPDEATARSIAEQRQAKLREESLAKTARLTLEDLHDRIQAGEVKELRVVLKADVQGSVEALSTALRQLSTDEVKLNILLASVGGIKESDVNLAAASDAIVIGFNVRPETKAAEEARRQGVEIRLYDVIYNAVNDVRDALAGLLGPVIREVPLGRAEVREVFRVPGVGNVAGVQVLDGKLLRNAEVRLVRDSVVVYTGRIASLRRFKEDVTEVAAGYECGVGLGNYQDIKVGDIIEAFRKEEVARRP